MLVGGAHWHWHAHSYAHNAYVSNWVSIVSNEPGNVGKSVLMTAIKRQISPCMIDTTS